MNSKLLIFCCSYIFVIQHYYAIETTLTVLNLNTWLLKTKPEEDFQDRLLTMHKAIDKADFDVILLQEVWYEPDHAKLRDLLRCSTEFLQLNNPNCKMVLDSLPERCSGLMILSKFRIIDAEFREFTKNEQYMIEDYGLLEVSKGVGKVRICLKNNITVDLFTAHMDAYNASTRLFQSREAADYLKESTADVTIYGADINDIPGSEPHKVFTEIQSDTMMDVYPNSSLDEAFTTWGNPKNSYVSEEEAGRIDHVMYKAGDEKITIETLEYKMYGTDYTNELHNQKFPSISDHEGIVVKFEIVSA